MKIRTVNAAVKFLQKHRDKIAAERDVLREVQDEIEDLCYDLDEGIAALDNAIDVFSYKQ